MKIEYLQSFVTLSNTLNYTKAAGSLYITQPTLSRHIQLLETELGCSLVARNTRQVQLTEEGRIFLNYATNMIFDYNRATRQLKELRYQPEHQLTIGFLRGGTDHYLLPMLQAFINDYPGFELQLQAGTHDELVTELRAGKLDLCMTMATTLIGIEKIKLHKVGDLALVLVVPDDHFLAQHETVTFTDFAEESYLCVQKQQTKAWYDYIISLFLSQGYYPLVNDSCSSVKTLLMQIALGKGISVLTEGCRSSAPSNIRLIPIGNVPTIQMVLGYREDNENLSLDLFISWLKEYLR
ncbi:LysR family transcriptional regulator [Candidatus Enterococcus ferrettii]|uniref:HTH lysR-type domain-containing protein n=1 Tax=Candidatus Enterococcus ferrettii TaxID=2815324 RepID=A0ABV0EHR7_9ENTE|nr:LysR family transcriptional regulator [Enterococcus sp. 665A]MBO1338539.1 LysR family transcriptional regulator [Enterococcus sp. 665A]